MENTKIKDRAYSLATYLPSTKQKTLESSPDFRPAEANDFPPPIFLSSNSLEDKMHIKDLLQEKEQDQHLINLLKKHSYEQDKEIEKLKKKIENLQHDYEILLNKSKHNSSDSHGILESVIIARSRSESLSNL